MARVDHQAIFVDVCIEEKKLIGRTILTIWADVTKFIFEKQFLTSSESFEGCPNQLPTDAVIV